MATRPAESCHVGADEEGDSVPPEDPTWEGQAPPVPARVAGTAWKVSPELGLKTSKTGPDAAHEATSSPSSAPPEAPGPPTSTLSRRERPADPQPAETAPRRQQPPSSRGVPPGGRPASSSRHAYPRRRPAPPGAPPEGLTPRRSPPPAKAGRGDPSAEEPGLPRVRLSPPPSGPAPPGSGCGRPTGTTTFPKTPRCARTTYDPPRAHAPSLRHRRTCP